MSVEPRTEAASSLSDTWPQTTPVDQRLMEVEQTLCEMSGILESARMNVVEYRAEGTTWIKRCTELGNAYNEERRARCECAQAYASLFAQHQKTMDDLQAMGDKCQFLHQELDAIQEAAHCRDSEVQEHEQALKDKALPSENKQSGIDWDMLEHEIEKARLEARIQKVEDEKLELMEKHQIELANAADHIQEVTQKIREFEEVHENRGLVQDGREICNKALWQKQTGQGNRGRKRKQAMKLKNGIEKQEM